MCPESDTRAAHPARCVTLLFRRLPGPARMPANDRGELKNFALTLSDTIGNAGRFTCLITGDEEMRQLNRDFLGYDYATDVLSFPASATNGDLGEIAISIDRAKVQAQEFGHTYLDELRILMLHGFLHLTGLDHERDGGVMARAERKWRTVLGLPSGLIARSRTAPRGGK